MHPSQYAADSHGTKAITSASFIADTLASSSYSCGKAHSGLSPIFLTSKHVWWQQTPSSRKKKVKDYSPQASQLHFFFKKRKHIPLWSVGEDQLRRIIKLKIVYFTWQLLSTHTVSQSLHPVPVKCAMEFETAMWMNAGWNTKISWESSAPLG